MKLETPFEFKEISELIDSESENKSSNNNLNFTRKYVDFLIDHSYYKYISKPIDIGFVVATTAAMISIVSITDIELSNNKNYIKFYSSDEGFKQYSLVSDVIRTQSQSNKTLNLRIEDFNQRYPTIERASEISDIIVETDNSNLPPNMIFQKKELEELRQTPEFITFNKTKNRNNIYSNLIKYVLLLPLILTGTYMATKIAKGQIVSSTLKKRANEIYS